VLVGCTLSHYKFLSLIGAGANGEVYLADDERLHRQVAIKVLSPLLLTDARARRRFRQEALTLSRLNHPNIATIHDFESIGDRDLLVMEYVPGETLSDLIERGALPEREVVQLGIQLLQGLGAAHGQGVIHRDLKPRNLRVTAEGHLKILDYGLAQFAAAVSANLTTRTGGATGSPFEGTPVYMAPEQLRGLTVDERSDLYAAGEILFEMMTARRPFSAANVFGLMDQVLHQPPPAPRAMNPHVSLALEEIVLRALEKSPDQRYQRAADFEASLRGLAPGVPVSRPPKRRRAAAYVTAILAGGIAALAAWYLASLEPTPPVMAFSARDWVLVSDVTGTSAQSRQAVREALTLALQQSRHVNVVPRERVVAALQRMQRPANALLDEASALDLCRRENAKVLLSPTMEASGNDWRISVRALDAGGRLLFVQRADVSSNLNMLADLDVLAARVRRALGESVTQIAGSRPLAQVTTHSTDALERYSRGIDQFARGDLSEAEASLRAALALDPRFAMAHFQLARALLKRGSALEERQHIEAAYRDRAKLTDRERHLIEAAYYDSREDYDKAEQTLRTLVGLYPDDANGRYELGMGLAFNGKVAGAIAQLTEAMRIDPFLGPAYSRLVLLLAETNQNAQALTVFEQAAQRNLATPELRWGRAMALFGLNQLAQARHEFAAMAASAQPSEQVIGRLYSSRLMIYEGRFAAAASELDQSVRADRLSGHSYPERVGLYLLGRLALLHGNHAEALLRARDMTAGDDVRVEHLHHAGHLQILGGALPAAENTLKRLLAISSERPNAFTRSCALQLQAKIAAKSGRTAKAADLFKEANAAYPTYHAHIGLAELAQSRLDWHAAAAEWRQVVAARGDILRHGFPADLVLADLQLARMGAKLGESVEAQAGYDRIVAAWQNGDDSMLRRRALEESSQFSDRRKK
jgi:tetratricopeptide (TPR) repeat protein/tRNA A-37 threonylcarbamoyl transferase component Bud32